MQSLQRVIHIFDSWNKNQLEMYQYSCVTLQTKRYSPSNNCFVEILINSHFFPLPKKIRFHCLILKHMKKRTLCACSPSRLPSSSTHACPVPICVMINDRLTFTLRFMCPRWFGCDSTLSITSGTSDLTYQSMQHSFWFRLL